MTTPEIDPLAGVAVFVAAARAGSFTRAGERLGMTKSAVGKSIARLEQRLGIPLFHRTTRLNKLTPDGEAFFATCAAAMDEIGATEAALTSRRQVLRGRLRIDMPVAFGRRVLLPMLFEIVRPHPALTLSLSFNDATIDPLLDDVDLVIRFGALKDSSHLVARHLADQERVICASPAYLQRHGMPATLADLQGHQGIVGSPQGPPMHWVVREQGAVKRIAPPRTHHLSDGESMVDAAIAGLGICQMPASLVRQAVARGALVPLLVELSTVPVEVHALWPRQAHLSPRVRYVIDQLVERAARGELS
jgi:DNA-binding transcriptional LysR family regulator